MAKQCSECNTVVTNASPYCDACGSQFSTAGAAEVKSSTLPIYVVCALIVAALMIVRAVLAAAL